MKKKMSLLTIDNNKCNSGGICVAECPMKILTMKDDGAIPELIDGGEEYCINCGHCVTVCPSDALSLKNMTPGQCVLIDKELNISQEQVEQFLQGRRSIRTYNDKSVSRDVLKKLMDIASFAPSGKNTQPVKWMVIEGKDEVSKLEGLVVDWMRYMIKEQPQIAKALTMDKVVEFYDAQGESAICCGAPHMIITYAHKNMPAAQEACVIALAYLELAAPTFDLGTCWAGYFNTAIKFWPPMQKELGLPEGHEPYGSMMIGSPKYKYKRIPLRKEADITWR